MLVKTLDGQLKSMCPQQACNSATNRAQVHYAGHDWQCHYFSGVLPLDRYVNESELVIFSQNFVSAFRPRIWLSYRTELALPTSGYFFDSSPRRLQSQPSQACQTALASISFGASLVWLVKKKKACKQLDMPHFERDNSWCSEYEPRMKMLEVPSLSSVSWWWAGRVSLECLFRMQQYEERNKNWERERECWTRMTSAWYCADADVIHNSVQMMTTRGATLLSFWCCCVYVGYREKLGAGYRGGFGDARWELEQLGAFSPAQRCRCELCHLACHCRKVPGYERHRHRGEWASRGKRILRIK